MEKLTMIVVPPSDFDRETLGHYCKYKLTQGEVHFDIDATSKGVRIFGEDEAIVVRDKEDLNVLAKAIGLAFAEYERKKILT